MDVPRIAEVTMTWQFGGWSKEHLQQNPDPPVFQDEDSPNPNAFVLSRVAAVLCGRKGEFEFDCRAPDGATDYRNEGSRRVEDLFRERISPLYHLPIPGFQWSRSSLEGDVRRFFFLFGPEPGKPLADAAFSGFTQAVGSLFPSENPVRLPIPTTVSRHFWMLGEERVSSDAALALDRYMDGGFRKVRQTYKAEGQKAAYRLYRRLYRTLRNDTRRDRPLGDFAGAEILVGKSDTDDLGRPMGYWEFRVDLIVDGFEVGWPRWMDSHVPAAEMIAHETRWCADEMDAFGIDTYKLTQGIRTRGEVPERVSCARLDDDELRAFTGEMLKRGCHELE
jgi:hypothetical protein